jgi:hypothetical protein
MKRDVRLSSLPEKAKLTSCLGRILRSWGLIGGHFEVLRREPNPEATNFSSEIVTCGLAAGQELRLFCKYGASRLQTHCGQLGGLAYEAAVYRHVVQPTGTSELRFFGSYDDDIEGHTWIILDQLDDAVSLDRAPETVSLVPGVTWMGHFHSASQGQVAGADFLNVYDAEYYLRWARRTRELAAPLRTTYPWLPRVCERYEQAVDWILSKEKVLIHGDCYPDNMLYRKGVVYPIDWELAALALGEIDLVSLTANWPVDIVTRCEDAYSRARWPAGEPADYPQTLELARMYLHFRWLGENAELTLADRSQWRFGELKRAAQRLGVI